MKKAGVYIHVPFCLKKCNYCSFYSVKYDDNSAEKYLNELLSEIRNVAIAHQDTEIQTVYFGGGTPSALSTEAIYRILNTIFKYFKHSQCEITIEVNPILSDNIKYYREIGINRISVGVQSTDNKILKRLGRLHTAEEAIACLDNTNKYFDNVSADLIIGVNDNQDINSDLDILLPRIHHLSSYMLSVEPGTTLYKMVHAKSISVASEERVVEQYNELYKKCTDNCFHRYEISNFSRKGYESKHNSSYWKLTDYFGFGPAAHSYIDGVRYYNSPVLERYLSGEHSGKNRQIIEREKSIEEDRLEYLMLSLRTSAGIDLEDYRLRFNSDFLEDYSEKLKKADGYLDVGNGRVCIRPQYFLVQNSIIGELL